MSVSTTPADGTSTLIVPTPVPSPREVRFIDAHVFAYSRRAGTPAATYDGQIPESVKRERSAELIRVKNEVRDLVLDGIVERGEALSVILETYDGQYYTAHSDTFVEVKVLASKGLSGELCEVIPVSHKDGVIHAKFIKCL